MNDDNDIRRGRHCVFMMHVHLVFVTKYRRGVFTKEILEALRPIFSSVCIDFGAELIEFDGEHDHVHLLVNYPPKIAVSKLVNSLKGISSLLIRKKNFPSIKKKLWGRALWSPSPQAILQQVVVVPLSTLFESISSNSKLHISLKKGRQCRPSYPSPP